MWKFWEKSCSRFFIIYLIIKNKFESKKKKKIREKSGKKKFKQKMQVKKEMIKQKKPITRCRNRFRDEKQA